MLIGQACYIRSRNLSYGMHAARMASHPVYFLFKLSPFYKSEVQNLQGSLSFPFIMFIIFDMVIHVQCACKSNQDGAPHAKVIALPCLLF